MKDPEITPEVVRASREADALLAAIADGRLPAPTASRALELLIERGRRDAELAGFTEGVRSAQDEQIRRQRFRDRLTAILLGQPDPEEVAK